MRFPRPHWSIRWLMVLVAIVAVCLGTGMLWRRNLDYRQEAKFCEDMATTHEMLAYRYYDLARFAPSQAANAKVQAHQVERRVEFFRRRAAVWRDAAAHPWRARPAGEPIPD